ncbi:MAG: hypothetical protein HY744_23790 [Deltaproteobacteria bacterium]|nr:hypothetical protein [Deltaproteobacteria bacterium]
MPPDGGQSPLERTLAEIAAEFPGFRIVPKQGSRLSRAIDLALKIVTLGGQREFLTRYHTVIGSTLYVPPGWQSAAEIEQVMTLRHERVHLRQRRRYTMPGLALLYLLPFFPLGLAYGRARLEWEAYAETLRATWEIEGPEAARSPELRRRIIAQFTGPAYGWMWPFPKMVGRWYDEALGRIEREA